MTIWPNPLPRMTVLWRFEQTPSLDVIYLNVPLLLGDQFYKLIFREIRLRLATVTEQLSFGTSEL